MLNNLKDVIGKWEELKKMVVANSGTEDKKKKKELAELKSRMLEDLKTVEAQLDKSAQGAKKVLKVAMVPIKSIDDANKALRGADMAWLCNPKNQNEIWGNQMIKRSKTFSDATRKSLNLLDEDLKKYYDQTLVIAKDMSNVVMIAKSEMEKISKLSPAAQKLYKSAEKLKKLLMKLDNGRVALLKNDYVLKALIKETKAEAAKKKKKTKLFAKVEQLADSVSLVLSKSLVATKFAENEFNAADLW